VSCGAGHTVVICDKGRVFGWGINQQGQLGIGLDEQGQVIGNVSEPQLVSWSENGVKSPRWRAASLIPCFCIQMGVLVHAG